MIPSMETKVSNNGCSYRNGCDGSDVAECNGRSVMFAATRTMNLFFFLMQLKEN